MLLGSAARGAAWVVAPGTAPPAWFARRPTRTAACAYTGTISRERWCTPANLITATRTTGAVGLGCAALAAGSLRLLVAAYLVYWLLDIADGAVARRFEHETRLGAVFDITADRASSLLCVAAFVTLRPGLAMPLGLYVIEFAVVDTMPPDESVGNDRGGVPRERTATSAPQAGGAARMFWRTALATWVLLTSL